MHDKLVNIQKGYILIERAKEKIDKLSKSQDIVDIRQVLEDMKKEQEELNISINELKDKIVDAQEEINEKEKQLSKVIKYLCSNTRKHATTLKQKKQLKLDLEEQREKLNCEVMDTFIMVDALKEKITEKKLDYNEKEKEFIRIVSSQNHKIVRYEDKISLMEKKIRRIRKGIDSEVLSIYDKKRQKNIMVMSRVQDGLCYNCGEEISDEEIDKIRNGEIIECPSCERILYLLNDDCDDSDDNDDTDE